MSRFNVFKLLRELRQSVKTYGNEELESIKQQTIQLKAQLEQLKAMREARKKQTEQLILQELRMSVSAMQQLDREMEFRRKQVEDTAKHMGRQMEQALEQHLEDKMASVVEGLDIGSIISGKASQAASQQPEQRGDDGKKK